MKAWENYVQWPECSDCRATGVAVDPKTQWPVECQRCKAGRENAVKKAQSARRKALKDGTAA